MYTVGFYTLGCKVNQYDTQALMEDFKARGFAIVDFHGPADAYVINTCTVTQVADGKARKAIRAAHRRNPEAVVAVCGCYAAGAPEEVERLPGVRVVMGNRDKGMLAEAVLRECRCRTGRVGEEKATGPWSSEDGGRGRTRALLKVQDGCNHVCAFCIVPRVRGPQRSRPPEEVLEEARRLVGSGYQEIVLTGVRLGAYGYDWEGRQGPRDRPLIELLHRLHQLEGLRRLRLSSLLPLDVTPDLLRTLTELPRLCPHLHLPLQSGDDGVLKRMRRGYRTRHFAALVEQARAYRPDLALTTDVMVGFPGETEAEFENTYRFCQQMRFAGMHIFPYSRRPQTEAASLPDQVPPALKERRRAALQALKSQLAADFHRAQIGRTVEVLVETNAGGRASGWTAHYIRVHLEEPARPGTFLQVQVTAADSEGVQGIIVGPRCGKPPVESPPKPESNEDHHDHQENL